MFALGKTVAKLSDACTDGASVGSAAEVADLVRVLTAGEASDRPSADVAAAHAFFQPLLAFRREQTSKCIGVHCNDLVRHSDGVLCAEGHLTCNQCLDGHVQSCAGEELRLLREREGRVFCPKKGGGLGCSAAAFSDSELGQTVSADVFESYVKGRMRLLESMIREELEGEGERRLLAELKRLQRDEAQRKVPPCPVLAALDLVLGLCVCGSVTRFGTHHMRSPAVLVLVGQVHRMNHTVICFTSVLLELTDVSQVDMLGLRYTPVNLGRRGVGGGSPDWWVAIV